MRLLRKIGIFCRLKNSEFNEWVNDCYHQEGIPLIVFARIAEFLAGTWIIGALILLTCEHGILTSWNMSSVGIAICMPIYIGFVILMFLAMVAAVLILIFNTSKWIIETAKDNWDIAEKILINKERNDK